MTNQTTAYEKLMKSCLVVACMSVLAQCSGDSKWFLGSWACSYEAHGDRVESQLTLGDGTWSLSFMGDPKASGSWTFADGKVNLTGWKRNGLTDPLDVKGDVEPGNTVNVSGPSSSTFPLDFEIVNDHLVRFQVRSRAIECVRLGES